MRPILFVCSVLSLSVSSLGAQPPRTAGGDPRAAMQSEAQKAMADFAWLIGEWEGPATVHLPNGGTLALVQRETVTAAAFNTALYIQGRGMMTTNGATRQAWDAAGLFGYDAMSKKHMFTSASGSGAMSTFGITVQGDGFTWGYTEASGAEARYEITRTPDGKWKEVGMSSTDGGKTWKTTMEFLLTKRP